MGAIWGIAKKKKKKWGGGGSSILSCEAQKCKGERMKQGGGGGGGGANAPPHPLVWDLSMRGNNNIMIQLLFLKKD